MNWHNSGTALKHEKVCPDIAIGFVHGGLLAALANCEHWRELGSDEYGSSELYWQFGYDLGGLYRRYDELHNYGQ